MTNIYTTSADNLQSRPLRQTSRFLTASLLVTMLMAGLWPAKLFAAPTINFFSGVFTTSSNALLSTIKLTPASILTNTGTSGNTTTYSTTAGNTTASVTVTPATQDPTATIRVNGVTVLSGTASGNIALGAEGTSTIINTVVTAQDGVTTHTYSITVNRAPSSDALLRILSLTPAGTLTNTGTAAGTTTYTATVSNGTASVTITPTALDADATIMVNGNLVASGTASGSIALAVGQTNISTIVTAQGGTATHTYSIIVTRAPSSNALLSILKLTPASVLTNTGTAGTTTTYTTSVGNATTSVTVTPTAQDNTSTIMVNGTAVVSETASGSIALAVGPNTITTVVTAQDGTTTRTYAITVTRLSNDALLTIIQLTPASTLSNTGTSGTTTTYTATVSNTTTSVTVTPTTQDANATVTVNGAAVASGTASGSIALALGQTTITTAVTAQDGTTTHTYSITITHAPSNNALLGTIALTPASPLTNTGTTGTTTTYTASVSNATASVTVTPTAQDATATIAVDGVAVISGMASGSIALAVGQNTITTVVTAQDGITTRTYSITVTRATGSGKNLYLPISVVQPTETLAIENDGVMVHQGVSPNGDGLNDYLHIDGLATYPDNNLTIINRSGAVIFEVKGYNNISKVFDGHSSINGRMLQQGTYFYSLNYVADGLNKHKTGFIILRY